MHSPPFEPQDPDPRNWPQPMTLNEASPAEPPKVLVQVCLSNDVLVIPVTVSTYGTAIHSTVGALLGQGLTFTDIPTGTQSRSSITHAPSSQPNWLDIFDPSIREIPINGMYSTPYEVDFTVYHADSSKNTEHPLTGLNTGHEHQVELDPKMAFFDWWKMGSKREVFAAPNRRREWREPGGYRPRLQMKIVNCARFLVDD
ncbi:unnamed protein product [Zymoseptoria tritici ST99CH_1A5]|uniref:Uncharacterized protein n=1 Tax=Zymoseptoria tritici ST99CH_1A5 TaxID=1276529 RepID=A0A1Y6LG81_ZYMTR|nr:unnamed protein product [Zymoseptoria tritici ST99CH_1A5]